MKELQNYKVLKMNEVNSLGECYVKSDNGLIEAEFIGIYQYSEVLEPSPMIGGHPGGVEAFPIALVKIDGKFKQVSTHAVVMVQED